MFERRIRNLENKMRDLKEQLNKLEKRIDEPLLPLLPMDPYRAVSLTRSRHGVPHVTPAPHSRRESP